MNKLKFNRLINLRITSNEAVTVPADEVWKGTFYGLDHSSGAQINDLSINETYPAFFCVEGAKINAFSKNTYGGVGIVTLQGIAFKAVENV